MEAMEDPEAESTFSSVGRQASKVRGCEAVGEWIEPIRNHFWHCAEQCAGDEQTKAMMFLSHEFCWQHLTTISICSAMTRKTRLARCSTKNSTAKGRGIMLSNGTKSSWKACSLRLLSTIFALAH